MSHGSSDRKSQPHAGLEDLLRARNACIRIVTDQEDEALDAVQGAALTTDSAIQTWSIINGIGPDYAKQRESGITTTDPAAALVYWKEKIAAGESVVCVCLDLSAHMAEPRVLRAFRDLVAHFAALNRSAAASPGNGAIAGVAVLVLIDHRADLPELAKSVSAEYEIPALDDEQVEEVARRTLRRLNSAHPIHIDISKAEWQAVIKNLLGLSRRQVEQLIASVVVPDSKFTSEDLHDLIAAKRRLIHGTGVLEFVETPASLDSVGGLGRLKKWLTDRAAAFAPDAAAFGLTPPRGILLLGVQGAGKSLCAKAVAAAWYRPLLKLDPGALYDKYVGESERRLRDTLRQAERMAPLVLWIDEIEKGFASAAAQSTDGGLSKRMFGTLLSWMQDHTSPVFLVATANDIEALPPELMRKGRFDEIFFVDLPGDEARREIWTIHLRKRKRDPANFDLNKLVACSAGFSGSEIEQALLSGLATAFAAKREPDTASLVAEMVATKPLSVTMKERVDALRRWAAQRCVPAE